MKKEALGLRIREARLKQGMTQQALAQAAGIGVMYLGEIERGVKMPSLNSFIRIVEVLGVSADYILRHEVTSGLDHVCGELEEKLRDLTPSQRKTAADILNAYLDNL